MNLMNVMLCNDLRMIGVIYILSMRRSVSCWLFCDLLGDLVVPKRDRMFTGEILLRKRIFSGKSDLSN